METEVTYTQFLAAAQKRRQRAKKLLAQGRTSKEVAKLLGVSRQRVEQMVRQ
jgi:transposase